MKKIFIVFLVLLAVPSYSQTKLSPEETLTLLNESNNLYCYVIKDLIECMFTFNQEKFDKALSNLKTVRKNFDNAEKNGTLTGSGAQVSLARARFNTNKWGVLSIFIDQKAYKTDKRNKSVKYNGEKRKIPKALARQFKDFVSREEKICY